MAVLRGILVALLVLVAPVSVARATDLMGVVTPAQPGPAFDWQGFYAGVYGGIWFGEDPDSPLLIGKLVGVNFVLNENVLMGVEARFACVVDSGPGCRYAEMVGLGRLGLAVGEDLLLYKALGLANWNDWGTGVSASGLYGAAGGGVELAVGENVSLRAEALYYWPIEDPSNPDFWALQGGVIWHFN